MAEEEMCENPFANIYLQENQPYVPPPVEFSPGKLKIVAKKMQIFNVFFSISK